MLLSRVVNEITVPFTTGVKMKTFIWLQVFSTITLIIMLLFNIKITDNSGGLGVVLLIFSFCLGSIVVFNSGMKEAEKNNDKFPLS